MKKKNAFLWALIFLSCNHQKRSHIEEQITGYCNCNFASFNLVRCDTTHFTTGAKTYWQWTCDSSWLTFETKQGGKKTIQSFYGENIPKSQNIGPYFIKELSNKLWFKQQKVSGCCYPPSHFILDSRSGKRLFTIKEDVFVQENTDLDVLFYFTDSTFKVLNLYNINKNRISSHILPENRITNTLKEAKVPYVKDIFEASTISKYGTVIIYNYYKEDSRIQWVRDSVLFKL